MIRRLIAIVLIVLGLGTLGAGIASGTVWKPDALVTVPLPAQPTENYVVSDPGVLTIVNPTVKVHVIAEDPETPVFLAMGRTADVAAWVMLFVTYHLIVVIYLNKILLFTNRILSSHL